MTSKNKTVIVLGSEGALGSELIQNLLQKNTFDIVAVDLHKKTQFSNKKIKYHQPDFSKPEQIKSLLKNLSLEISDENILISTIGKFGSDHENENVDFNSILETIQINLLGVVQTCLEIGNQCVKQNKKLRIVIVGSTAGFVGSRDIGYGISKSGLNGLVLSMSKCFAKKNVTVIGVNPGIFESAMSTSVSKERQQSVISNTHLKRTGTISEISNTVLYAALTAPDFLTGSLININGGQYS